MCSIASKNVVVVDVTGVRAVIRLLCPIELAEMELGPAGPISKMLVVAILNG